MVELDVFRQMKECLSYNARCKLKKKTFMMYLTAVIIQLKKISRDHILVRPFGLP